MDWLAEDPPTWDWGPHPEYLSLRQKRIIAAYHDSWSKFVAAHPYGKGSFRYGHV